MSSGRFRDLRWEDRVLFTLLIGVIVFALSLGGYVIARAVDSDGKADYCFIRPCNAWGCEGKFSLVQHIPWVSDRPVGEFKTFDEAHAAAEKISCPIK